MAENDDKKDPPATGDKPDDEVMDTDAGKAALKRERDRVKALEAEVKDLKPKAAKAQQLEDDKLGETEKLTKQIADLTRERDAATADSTRYKVALDKGLTLAQAKRLSGATEVELTADADAYREEHGIKDEGDGKKPPPKGKPTEHLRGGGDPDDDSQAVDTRKIVDSIPRGF